MGFGAIGGMAPPAIRINDPTFKTRGGGGKITTTIALSNPTFTLT